MKTEEEWLAEFQRMESQRSTPRFEFEIRRVSDLPPLTKLEILRMSLGQKVNEAKTAQSRWNAIRAYYAVAIEHIMAVPANHRAIPKYEVDWHQVYTPIEKILAEEAQYLGIILYPQFPIAAYFVDFANPVAKVVIECDGKAFHDPEKDRKRDEFLTQLGWMVYRFTGAECHRVDRQDNGLHIDDDPRPYGYDFMPSVAAVKLRAIGVQHDITFRPHILAQVSPDSWTEDE